MSGFDGFSTASSKFLKDLTKNNDTAWFKKNKPRYEEHYLEPAKAFVEAMGPRLLKISDDINAEPKVNGSIFRINRDIRFSKDKTPYKNHLDLWFWSGPDRKSGFSGFFFRMYADRLILGAGVHGFDKPVLANYRDAVDDDKTGGALVKLAKKMEKAGYEMTGETYKKVPRGYDPDHARAKWLKHSSLAVHFETKLPAEARSKKFLTFVSAHFKRMAPVHEWLLQVR